MSSNCAARVNSHPPPGRVLALVIFTMLAVFPVAHAPAQTNQPNIIVLMADDLDVGSLETMLANNLMPNFATYFVDQGIKFEQSFVTNAVCCPSRATFLSGQYSHNHQALTNSFNGSVQAFEDTTALPTWLKAAGYRTAHVGKYLNAYGYFSELHDPLPTATTSPFIQKIVEDFAANLLSALTGQPPSAFKRLRQTYVPPGWSEWYGLLDTSAYCTYNFKINENGQVTQYLKNGRVVRNAVWNMAQIRPPINDGQLHNYQTDVLADLSVDFLRRATTDTTQAARPFFLAIMPLAPHIEACGRYDPDGPKAKFKVYKDQFQAFIRPAPRHQALQPSLRDLGASLLPQPQVAGTRSFNEQDLSGKPREFQSKLLLLDQYDQSGLFNQYGNRLASLVALDDLIGRVVGELQRNGQLENTIIFFTSDNGWFYGEHRLSAKMLAYEEAIRVPLYVRVPGSAGGQRVSHLTLNNDLAPTIAELAGARPTLTVDGRSFVPLLQGPQAALPWRKQFLVEHYLGVWPEQDIRVFDAANAFAIRTGSGSTLPNRKYIEYYDGVQRGSSGYYLSERQKQPSGQFVWQGPLLDNEYYDLDADALEVDNLLHDVAADPNEQQILDETAELKTLLGQLLPCKGDACRQLEDQ
jgi:N-acetylglucosamine-6-sulfatase